MTTTTSYGTWVNHGDHYTVSLEATLTDYINGGDDDWRERVENTGAFTRMATAYRGQINDALPGDVALCGDEFIGPWQPADDEFEGYPTDEDGALDIAACIEDIDLQAIVEQYDPDLTTVVLVSASPGDRVPGHELGDPERPEVPRLLEQPEVAAFLAAHDYDPEHPDELMYVVTDETQIDEIPDGYPTLSVRI